MRSNVMFGSVAAAVLIIALISLSDSQILSKANGGILAGRETNTPVKPELPGFAQKTMRVAEAYIFAVQNQDKVMYLPCYCGCAGMQHSEKLLRHESLKDCYLKPDGSYEPHASECKLCNDITLEARDLLMKGYSLKEVRTLIDTEYSGRGVGTNTPLPP